jgi:polygalacturonase
MAKPHTPAVNGPSTPRRRLAGASFGSRRKLSRHSIHLRNHITLFLDPGATIVAAESPAAGASGGYDPPTNAWDKFPGFGHSHWLRPDLGWGSDCVYRRSGLIWKGLSRGDRGAKTPLSRQQSISLKNCRNVNLRDISILRRTFRHPHLRRDNLTIDNLKCY